MLSVACSRRTLLTPCREAGLRSCLTTPDAAGCLQSRIVGNQIARCHHPPTALTVATGGKPARGPFCNTRMRFECRMYAFMYP